MATTYDAHKNFAYSTVATAPTPAASGTSLVVSAADGTKFPTAPFNATVWPSGTQPTTANAEIVRVTNIATDTFTITRTQEGTNARTIIVGDQIAATVTAKTFTDIESNYGVSFSPFLLQTGSGLATYASTAASVTGSAIVFPVSLQAPVKFNQIMLPVSLSYITSNTTGGLNNSFYSYFGLYSQSSNSLLTLISSNSFSIGETLSVNSGTAASLTWNFPTSTATAGYGYGSFAAGNLTATVQISSYISGSRIVGLQFGGEMSLSGGNYWLGLLQVRSTAATSNFGLSNAGLFGQVINPINMVGTQSGMMPLGLPAADWQNRTTVNTAWFGRHLMGMLTNTSIPNFGGSKLPDSITMSQLGAVAGSTVSVLPAVTFVST